MRKLAVASLAMLIALPLFAHVTPNIELIKKGELVRQSLPHASKFLEQRLTLSGADLATVRKATGWTPSEEDARLYVGRDDQGHLLGRVILLWMPSEHGPVGVGVGFDDGGKIVRAAVTDVGSEPLAWVRPLLANQGMTAFVGLGPDAAPDPAKLAPAVTGKMSRYYAEVIAQGVVRAQALERVALAAEK
jgi:hypothetical protein